MRALVHVLIAVLLTAGCARSPRVPDGSVLVPAVDPSSDGFEVVGGDLAVDDTLGVHVVFALGRPGETTAQVQYARGKASADAMRWSGVRVLLPEGGAHPRIVLADTILHVIVGERLRHLASTNGGLGWHDLRTMIPPDSSWSAAFGLVNKGGTVFIASIERPSLPDPEAPAEGRREYRVHIWRMGNRVESRLLWIDRTDLAAQRFPTIALGDSGVEIRYRIARGASLFYESKDEGATWTQGGRGTARLDPQVETGPDVLAQRTVQARIFTLTKSRGEPRVFLGIRPEVPR